MATQEAPEPNEALSAVTTPRCRNCGAALMGRYCVDCSQAAEVHVPSTRELVHEALEGLTHADSRLWSTLVPLWFNPGKLTNEFISGRRVAYVPPFRLYLVLSVIFFVIASLHGLHPDTALFDDSAETKDGNSTFCQELGSSIPMQNWSTRITHACAAVKQDNGANWLHLAVATMPKAMFIFLPLIAFLHMLMYWWPRHRYAEHLLFFLHLHAMFFSVAIVLILLFSVAGTWPRLDAAAGVLIDLLVLSLPIYSYIALRRVFGAGWMLTLLKSCVLFVMYFTVLGLGVAGVFVYAALQL